MLVPILCPSKWAPTCQAQTNKKHLSLSFALKVRIHLLRKFRNRESPMLNKFCFPRSVCILVMSIYILFVK